MPVSHRLFPKLVKARPGNERRDRSHRRSCRDVSRDCYDEWSERSRRSLVPASMPLSLIDELRTRVVNEYEREIGEGREGGGARPRSRELWNETWKFSRKATRIAFVAACSRWVWCRWKGRSLLDFRLCCGGSVMLAWKLVFDCSRLFVINWKKFLIYVSQLVRSTRILKSMFYFFYKRLLFILKENCKIYLSKEINLN